MPAFGGNQIKVTPEQLLTHAQNMDNYISGIRQSFADMDQKVSQLSSYWEGDAYEVYKTAYYGEKEEIEAIIKRIIAIPEALRSISGVYSQTETEVTELSDLLPGDVIV